MLVPAVKSDISRWNSRYESHQYEQRIQPDPILENHRYLLRSKGNALDLAAGVCDNALFLAACGNAAFAIDASHVALRLGKQKAAANGLELNCLVADLDTYPIPGDLFDVVIVVRYLNRNLMGAVKQTLTTGGLLFYKTFNLRFLDQKPSFPSEYVLEDGELSHWFGDWECIDTNENLPGDSPQSYWVGRKS